MRKTLKFLLSIFLSSLLVACFAIWKGGVTQAATIIQTNITDTIGTFRTNVNTSLTNLNNAITGGTVDTQVQFGMLGGSSTSSLNFTFSTSTGAMTVVSSSLANVSSTNISASGFIQGGSLTLNAVNFTSLQGSGLTISAGALTCVTGTASLFGCLTGANYTIFNAKQAALNVVDGQMLFGILGTNTSSSLTLTFTSSSALFSVSATSSFSGVASATANWTFGGANTQILNKFIIPIGTTLASPGQISIDTTTGTFNFYDATQRVVSPTSTLSWTVQNETGPNQDDPFWIAPFNGTITNIVSVNKSSGTVPYNIGWGASDATATGTIKKAFKSYYTASSTTNLEKTAINGSSTFVSGDIFRYLDDNASSTEFNVTISYTPAP